MLCDEIRPLRLARDIAQTHLFDCLGVSNWENSNIQPSVELLEKLAVFSCPHRHASGPGVRRPNQCLRPDRSTGRAYA